MTHIHVCHILKLCAANETPIFSHDIYRQNSGAYHFAQITEKSIPATLVHAGYYS